MPRILFFLISLLLFLTGYTQKGNDSSAPIKHHNKIDDINTAFQIEKLLKLTDKRLFSNFHVTNRIDSVSRCGRLGDSVHAVPYFKGDFDNNGYTDLIVVGDISSSPYALCLLDSGQKNPRVLWLSIDRMTDCVYPVLSSAGSIPTVEFYYSKQDYTNSGSSEIIVHKELIFKSGGFVEYNPEPIDYKIEKIEFETTMCFGTCPVFKMTIDSSRAAVFESIKFNVQKTGKYQTRIDNKTYLFLKDLLNYSNFPMLHDSYRVDWTDDQTSTLKITYDNGKVKTIQDYGLIATFGLSQAYKILFNLRGSQSWK